MPKLPLPVIIIACVLIASGVAGLAYHFPEFGTKDPFQFDVIGVALIRLAAIVAGAFMLRGQNWARWLALAWIAAHVVIGAFHSMQQLIVHCVVFALFAFFLTRPAANEYFRGKGTAAT
jgi:hypothetical protein